MAENGATEGGSEQQPLPKIPQPKVDQASTAATIDAAQELTAYAFREEGALKRGIWDWRLVFGLKAVLFGFIIIVNTAWIYMVRNMLWRSGSVGGNFHLDNSVLIALVSTSIANFLGLVVVIARHLFPTGR